LVIGQAGLKSILLCPFSVDRRHHTRLSTRVAGRYGQCKTFEPEFGQRVFASQTVTHMSCWLRL